MSLSNEQEQNVFLQGSLSLLFAKTAAPIILVMTVNGLFTLVDAYFLGVFVGDDALVAVTLMFPLYMLLVALSTLVSSGFSSLYARLLGGSTRKEGQAVYGQALLLSLLVCALLIGIFLIGGEQLTLQVANGSQHLADLGYTYISLLIFFSPLVFVLAINVDALRCEGLLSAMAAISIGSSLLNVVFNYVLIVLLEWGVAGSAYGTILAQACSILAIAVLRWAGREGVQHLPLSLGYNGRNWRDLLALGAPSSLGYLGIALSSGLTLYCLQLWAGDNYEPIAGAFGIVTRLMTFSFLPLLGLSLAFQTIVGNNYGAKIWARSDRSLVLALIVAIVYCLLVQTGFYLSRFAIGRLFVEDPAIIQELARILPLVTLLLFVFGPLMMISSYFQAIGDAGRAAILGLSRTYVFALPLTFLLPFWFGEPGIWYGGIVAEVLMLLLTLAVLVLRARQQGHPWGLFQEKAVLSV
ncbi:MATE family efflux transporter [Rhodovibrionaceae bacterium A322]